MKNLILLIALGAACFGQAQPGVRMVVCADAGANDTYTCTAAPTVASYTGGMMIRLTVNTANTGAATLNIDSVGAKSISKIKGGITTALADNDMVPKGTYLLVYNATDDDFKVISETGSTDSGGGGTNPTIYATGKQASTTISSSYTDLTGASTSTTLAAGKCLRITYRTVNATTTAKNLALVVGSTTHNIYSASSTSSAFYGQLMFCNDASVQNAQTMFPVIHATAGTAAVTLRTKDDWAEDMSTAKTIKLQGKCDTSCSDTVQVNTFVVEKLEN